MTKSRPARLIFLFVAVFIALLGGTCMAEAPKIVIAHRAASGYLPEHTLPAVAMAYAFGVDYIEQDVALTKDGVLVVSHDIHLGATTNVSQVFPERKRDDGNYYIIDFTLDEIKTLRVNERVNAKTGVPSYKGRFPVGASRFEIATFAEVIELIQGLNKSTGQNIGIYPELKSPAFHHRAGYDIEQAFLDVLDKYGYTAPDARIFVQCFEADSLKRLRQLGCELPLVFLGATVKTNLDEVAMYANGIGPSMASIETTAGQPVEDYALVREAHARGLVVHPYTFRKDSMPRAYNDFEELLRHFFYDIGVDGVFTDFADIAVRVVAEQGQ